MITEIHGGVLDVASGYLASGRTVEVFGIPVSGLPYARALSSRLRIEMNIVPVAKIRMLGLPFVGLGALSSEDVFLNKETISELRIADDVVEIAVKEARQRLKLMMSSELRFDQGGSRPIDLAIIVDDAIASGGTIGTADRWVSNNHQVGKKIYFCNIIDIDKVNHFKLVGIEVFSHRECSSVEMQQLRTSQHRRVND